MALTEKLNVLITASGSQATREFQKVGKAASTNLGKAEQASLALGSAFKSLAPTAAVGAVTAAGAAISAFAAASVKSAAALGEQQSATNVIFGRGSQVVLDYATTTAGALGISNRAALTAANSFGDLFVNLGYTQEQSARASVGLVQLAGDLASFKNLDTDVVLQKLQSGLVGETEPLRQLGIFINEAAVKSKALELGLGGVGRELTDGEKVQARYAIIVASTSNAQGDAARTADSLANKQRQANAQLEDTQANIGKQLVPATQQATTRFQELLNVVDKVGGAFGEQGKGVARFADIAENRLIPVLGPLKFVLDRVGKSNTDAASTADILADATGALVEGSTLATGSLEDQAAATVRLEKAQKGASSAIEGAAAAERGVADAQHNIAQADRAAAAAARGVADARRGVRDAQERLNDVLADGGDVAYRVAEAERGLAQAGEAVADAQERVADAQKKINDLRAGPSANERGDADRAVRRAQLNVSDAEARLAKATKTAADLRAGKAPAGQRFATAADRAEALAEADREVADAALAVEDANDSLADSQQEQTDLLERGTEGSKEMSDAQRTLRDATREVAEAVHRQEGAQRTLSDANDGVAQHERDIRDAREGLATATQRVADASNSAAEASRNAAKAREAYSEAVVKAARAHADENKLIDESLTGLLLYRRELEALASQSPALFRALQPLLDRVNTLISESYDQGSGGDPHVRVSDAGSAYGDIFDRPTIGLFGEAGPEMVLPLSQSKRGFALDLIRKAGLDDDHQFANGAIIGAGPRYSAGSLYRARAAAKGGDTIFQIGPIHASGRGEGQAAGEAIVGALVQWCRDNGAIPVRVRG